MRMPRPEGVTIEQIEGGVTAPAGFRAAGVACGIKKTGALDLAIVVADAPAAAAGVFTTNRTQGAPVWCRANTSREAAATRAPLS